MKNSDSIIKCLFANNSFRNKRDDITVWIAEAFMNVQRPIRLSMCDALSVYERAKPYPFMNVRRPIHFQMFS